MTFDLSKDNTEIIINRNKIDENKINIEKFYSELSREREQKICSAYCYFKNDLNFKEFENIFLKDLYVEYYI